MVGEDAEGGEVRGREGGGGGEVREAGIALGEGLVMAKRGRGGEGWRAGAEGGGKGMHLDVVVVVSFHGGMLDAVGDERLLWVLVFVNGEVQDHFKRLSGRMKL